MPRAPRTALTLLFKRHITPPHRYLISLGLPPGGPGPLCPIPSFLGDKISRTFFVRDRNNRSPDLRVQAHRTAFTSEMTSRRRPRPHDLSVSPRPEVCDPPPPPPPPEFPVPHPSPSGCLAVAGLLEAATAWQVRPPFLKLRPPRDWRSILSFWPRSSG